MFHSLRGQLIVLLVLLCAAALAAGVLMAGLFRLSATAQVGRAEADIGRACDAVAGAYQFYAAGWQGPPDGPESDGLRRGLAAVVQTALRDQAGIEGGIWQADAGSLAYAYPTYQGSGPKTDIPQAELPRIRVINQTALANDRPAGSRYEARSQVLLLAACPLPGPMPNLTAWTMTRVPTRGGNGYWLLMAGLGVLLTAVLAAAALLMRLTMTWSRHVERIETALRARNVTELPALAATGERELDCIVSALNDAGSRLAETRRRADRLAQQVATGERLAAIGRVAAGLAHEIRNPIAAMRLKAENALVGDAQRKDQALAVMLEQIARLDALLRRLLSMTESEKPHCISVALGPFLESCLAPHHELARSKSVTLACDAEDFTASFDPDQMRRAIENLLLNAIEAAPAGTAITLRAHRDGENLVISVHDEGAGPPAEIRDHLFEPFVTGRAQGTGLGLSIVREVALAHGGTARLGIDSGAGPAAGTTFEIVLPCHPF